VVSRRRQNNLEMKSTGFDTQKLTLKGSETQTRELKTIKTLEENIKGNLHDS
jgi:hypothetical protein